VNYRVFRNLAIERALPPPAPTDLLAVEAALGAKLPRLVRDFLVAAQGGAIRYVFDVPVQKGTLQPMIFGQILEVADLVKEIQRVREQLGAPETILPFARDGADSIVMLDLKTGKVTVALSGRPAWTGRQRGAGLIDLAPTFEAYLEALHVDRQAIVEALEEHAKTVEEVDVTVTFLDIGLPGWRANSKIAAAVSRARKRLTPEVVPKVKKKTKSR
jgi:hypothetical protein